VYVRVGAAYLVIFECEYADARALARAAVVKYA
jgi:hypothetical protein